jgi:hypothetical protein
MPTQTRIWHAETGYKDLINRQALENMATESEIFFFVFVGVLGGGPLLVLVCYGIGHLIDGISRIRFDNAEASARDAYQPVIQQDISLYV